MDSFKSFLIKLPKAILLVSYIVVTIGLWTLFIVFPFAIDDSSKYIGMVAFLAIQFGISLLFKKLTIIKRNSIEFIKYFVSKECIDAIKAEEADAKLARADKDHRKARFDRMKPKVALYGTASLIVLIAITNIPTSKETKQVAPTEVVSDSAPKKTSGKKDAASLLWNIFHKDEVNDKKIASDDAIYLDRVYGEDAKIIYRIMKANGLLPDKDGSDKSKMAAIAISGYVSRDDDPCYDGKNQSKCLVYIKEAMASDKYKSEMPTLLARIKPIPLATSDEREKVAHEGGRGLCEDSILTMVTMPSTVSFSLGSHVDLYTDGTYELTGKFTHKNQYGQDMKKQYKCAITLTKLGFGIKSTQITGISETY